MMKALCRSILAVVLLAGSVAHGEVPAAYRRIAPQYDLPVVVLYAVALCESGRRIESGFRPWPWTLNINGEGQVFQDKQHAVQAAAEAIDRGSTVDLGIMQVNWHYHGHRFHGVSEALDPYANLKVGAAILREYARKHGSLWQGIGHYHSGTPERADAYQARCARILVDTLDRQQSRDHRAGGVRNG
ncbi:MAG: lytic transglycosylase domain-containing protein [Gammaproteobacteria bacterium]|nr:lytic transglycosylase domain-containing protein [Gammaproteobacteria bacterium]